MLTSSKVGGFLPKASLFLDPNPSRFRVGLPTNFLTSTGQVNFPTSNTVINVNYTGFTPAAQTAFQFAVDIWESLLDSSVPINVNASFANLGSGILGQAGPEDFFINFSGAPQTNTWYPIALANSLAGQDLDPTASDIGSQFNSNFNWYYGLDNNVPTNQISFVSVVLHELGHGLGFLGLMDNQSGVGSWGFGTGFPGIYDRFTENGSGQSLLNTSLFPNPSTALGSQLTSNNIFFDGSNANAANGGNRVKLYAPSTWSGGSSYAHLDEVFNNTPNALMTYSIGSGESILNPGPVTLGLFKDMGWKLAGSSTNPTLAIAATNANQTEGNSGSKAFTFTVTRAVNTTGANNVNWAVTGSGTSAANATDFVGGVLPSGTVSFAAGETSKVITVNVQGDTTVEPNENFTVTLSNPTNGATITTATAVGTIQNDDEGTSVTLASNYSGVSENGKTNLVYNFTRSGATTNSLTVNFTLGGTATRGNDYNAYGGNFVSPTTGNIVFASGQTTAQIEIVTTGDTVKEANETIAFTLASGTGYTIGTPGAVTTTILNDDGVLNQQGTTGNDVIEAGTTRNLSGRAGHDILIGSNASDMLVGAAGNDTITSGAGFDVIAYSLASEGQDTITDFNVFQDTLQVSAAGFGGGLIAGESIAAAQFVLGTVATTASHRFIFNKPTGQLFFDVDGNGSSVQTLLATLTPNLNLTEDNIFAA
jgi:Ca2+-binding RTX toxin-like protein